MMQIEDQNITQTSRTLKDYIPLVITFFVGLILLSGYQNTALYVTGVLDSIVNKSLFLHILHHLGYAAVCSVLFAFLFNLLENKKPNLGFKTVRLIFAVLLVIEGFLTTYFIGNYEPLGANGLFGSSAGPIQFNMLNALIVISFTLLACYFLYRYTAPLYKVISRMYPFTIILFSMFLATLYSDRKPINENKTQHFLEAIYSAAFEVDNYEGSEEYPLARAYVPNSGLHPYFNLAAEKPHIKILIVEGLGSAFVDANGTYSGIMPHLQELTGASLYWPNFLSNTGEGAAALPTVIGSLPFGETGFTNLNDFTHRHTLFSILKQNGYDTSFNYGGNSALNSYDRFLVQEGVDQILDKTVFGKTYTLQAADAAGITLGYPDAALFQRYTEGNKLGNTRPQLAVFKTLSTKTPYSIPNYRNYEKKVEKLIRRYAANEKSQRFISHNMELFASYSYADEAIANFLNEERKSKAYKNTIYIITGSHLNRNIPAENSLKRYQVPLLIYSPLVKRPSKITNIASHADIAPAIISLLDKEFSLEVPKTIAWLGNGELATKEVDFDKEIPLFMGANNIKDYMHHSFFLTDGDVVQLDENLSFTDNEIPEETISAVNNRFRYNKSVNKYVTQNDKIIPSELSSVSNDKREFSKTETIWLQSVFNGKDFDDAYKTARKLAFDSDWDRALLLCEHILSQIPRHADTEILKGRIYSWKEEYDKSVIILKEVVRKYPEYADGYCALMDTHYWSNPEQDIRPLLQQIERHQINDALLNVKIERANEHKLMSENPIVKLEMP
jgi:tetratricopeptide (TPR) repeat protein